MSFVNTVDIIGDEALTNSILNGSITEIADNRVTSVGDSAFRGCSALIRADFPSVTGIYNTAFYDCSVLTTLILRSETMCTLYYTGSFDGSPIAAGTGYIYVPSALYDSYRADSKWSTLANQFRKLEDYTVDGTVTGEVDPNRKMVRFFNDDGTYLGYVVVPHGGNATYNGTPVCSEDSSWPFKGFAPEPTNVTADMDCYAQYREPFDLETASWARISEISAEGTAANYMSVGDTKSVALKGTVGTLELDATYYAYIIGFDHNKDIEGTGIHFGTFKTANGISICLDDSKYSGTSVDGTKYFTINHWSYGNDRGGWAGCDLRYDILGSTDVAPSEYGTSPTVDRIGYNATETCATNPVPNTLMAALPSDLRSVMKPMTKYTNNKGNNNKTEAAITATIDYLPLLSAFEVHGALGYALSFEQNNQSQYAYYATGNAKVKYRSSNVSTSAKWWMRSPSKNGSAFCTTETSGYSGTANTQNSLGIAPIFKV